MFIKIPHLMGKSLAILKEKQMEGKYETLNIRDS